MPRGKDFMQAIPSTGSQWPEARGFARTYARDPFLQSTFLENLLGFRKMIDEWGSHDTKDDQLEAIDTTIRTFIDNFSDCLRPIPMDRLDSDIGAFIDYVPEDRLLHALEIVGIKVEEIDEISE